MAEEEVRQLREQLTWWKVECARRDDRLVNLTLALQSSHETLREERENFAEGLRVARELLERLQIIPQ
jgi:hypothetical protein